MASPGITPPWQRAALHGLVAVIFTAAAFGLRHELATPAASPEAAAASASSSASRPVTAPRESQPPLEIAGLDDAALARLMEDQPMPMMAAIDAMTDREEALRLAKLCVAAVAGPDFDLLVAWARRQKDPKITAAIFSGLLPRWVRDDPAGCIAFACEMGGDADAMKAKDVLLRTLPGRLNIDMLAQLPEDQRAQLLKQRPGRLAVTNPEGALDLIARLQPSDTRRDALTGLVEKWAGDIDVYHTADPLAAVSHVQQISDDALRGDGLRAAAAGWCRSNPSGAARWAEALPAGPDKDSALQGLVQFYAAKDSGRALTWAQQIGDSTLREAAVKKLQKP